MTARYIFKVSTALTPVWIYSAVRTQENQVVARQTMKPNIVVNISSIRFDFGLAL